TVGLTLSAPTGGATLGTPSKATLTIADFEEGVLAFSSPTFSVDENGATTEAITVTRTAGSSGAVSVDYATANGTTGPPATAGSDYTAKTGTLNWAAGDSAPKTITIPITDDAVSEGRETGNLSLSTPTGGARLGAQSTAALTIKPSDGQVVNATAKVP